MADKQKMASGRLHDFFFALSDCVCACVCAVVIENYPYQSSVYLPSPSHGLGKLLLVGAGVFVSGDVPGRVHHVHTPGLPLPAAAVVEALLVRAGELAGVCEAAHRGGRHRSLWGFTKTPSLLKSFIQLYSSFFDHSTYVHYGGLTVTPEITGAFPSISLKTSASASSAGFSLYFFLASSPSAALNSSNVMLRQDFFLKCARQTCQRLKADPALEG